MKKFFNLWAVIACLVFASCENDDPIIPADADDNFVTNVTMTVDGTSYSAVIENNTITITVPYTVSLNNAEVVFEYTPSATIMPDPTTITDWDTERTFRVTSYNGEANEYAYKVIKDDIRHEGNVELKTASDVIKFAETSTTIIKGNLIIGSDAENAEAISDISALSILKEVEGLIIIKNSYTGQDLTGLENITTIGGLQIGTNETYAINPNMHMISMKSLNTVTNDIIIRNNLISFIKFDNLTRIGGNVVIASSTLQTFEFPLLQTIGAKLDIQGTTDDENAGGEIVSIEIPELTTINGELNINNLANLTSIKLPKLTEVGSINFATLPVIFETLTLTELQIVNGDMFVKSQYVVGDAFTSSGNTKMLNIDGLELLTVVKGTLTISQFEELETLPSFGKLAQLGGINLDRLPKYFNKELDLSNVEFVSYENIEPAITFGVGTFVSKLITREDMSNVSIYFECTTTAKNPGKPISPEINFKKVKNFTYIASADEDVDLEFPIEVVYGNLDIDIRCDYKGLSLPNLTSVDGYMCVQCRETRKLYLPKLETIGGQFMFRGQTKYNDFTYDVSKLKTVCLNADPQYAPITGVNNIGSFDVIMDSSIDLVFPALEQVGGIGLTVRTGGIQCPMLHTISGTLNIVNCKKRETPADLQVLKHLSGLYCKNAKKMFDFSMFGPFISDGQITEENWSVTGCGYNPTYQDMKEGRYTQQ